MTSTSFDLDRHLAEEHHLSPFSTYLKEIVYGGTDGIVTTFAVVAGFTGAQSQGFGSLPLIVVLLFGFANLFADGVSMALGNFLSTRSDIDVYRNERKKEQKEIRENPEIEEVESVEILIRKGFNPQEARTLVSIYKKNTQYWLDFMMSQELEMKNPESDKPIVMSLATFLSFISFGVIPLLPYMLFHDFSRVFLLSVLATGGALILLGLFRWRVARQTVKRSVVESLLLGGTAAAVAYFVGTLFRI